MVGGAGLGYGAAKGGLDALETALGYRQGPQSAGEALTGGAKDVLVGASMDAGSRAVAPVLAGAVGKVMDLGQMGTLRASKLAKDALTKDSPRGVQDTVNALRGAAGKDVSASQATAGMNSPTWQALMERAGSRNPAAQAALAARQDAESVKALARAAGGDTATATRATSEQAQTNLNKITTPMREAALGRANLGKEVAALETRAAEMGEGAAAKVQEVRDLISAGNKAEAWARLDLIKRSLPVGATKYTHFGELSQKALGEWSDNAAKGSLDLGEGARYAKQAAEALRANGIQPLKPDTLASRIRGVLNNPKLAANDEVEAVVGRLSDDLKKWTDKGGVIDANALYAIRKNSATAAIRDLLKGQAPDVQQKTAARVMDDLKPFIDDASEGAGGKGFKDYLVRHSEGMQKIAEKRLMGEGLDLWKTNKDGFVKLVQGESPEVVEKVLGPGKFNIAQDLANSHMTVLREQAVKALRDKSVADQASKGQEALRNLLLDDLPKWRLPSYLSVVTSSVNKGLGVLETKLGKATMDTLSKASESPEAARKLLETLPAKERVRILNILRNPQSWSPGASAMVRGGTTGAVALTDQSDKE
jgi:hypothetical protein